MVWLNDFRRSWIEKISKLFQWIWISDSTSLEVLVKKLEQNWYVDVSYVHEASFRMLSSFLFANHLNISTKPASNFKPPPDSAPNAIVLFFRKIRKKTPTPTKFFMMSSPKFLGGFMIHFDFDYYFFSMGWVGKQPPTSRRSPEKRPKEDQGQPLSVSIRHDLPLMVAADLIHGFGSQ